VGFRVAVDYRKYPMLNTRTPCIQPPMSMIFAVAVFCAAMVQNRASVPAASAATTQAADAPSAVTGAQGDSAASGIAQPGGVEKPGAETSGTEKPVAEKKVSLVRGILKQVDPIHDQLLVRTFGGGQLRINFDGRTQLLAENKTMRLTSLPAGSVVSVDAVMDEGKFFARSVRTGASIAAQLEGQIVQYDAAKSQIALRDPISPQPVTLHVTPNTIVINQGQPASSQVLASGMLVRVSVDTAQRAADKIEILAERGSSFTFQGRVVAVDLRARVLSLLNDTDHNIHDLALGSLDVGSIGILREGAEVTVQAEFDGERYNVRSVALVAHNP
jgi:hypothetical protein